MLTKSDENKSTKFQPFAFKAKELAKRKRASDPAFKQAYDALETDFAGSSSRVRIESSRCSATHGS
jgi:hypothetical protein